MASSTANPNLTSLALLNEQTTGSKHREVDLSLVLPIEVVQNASSFLRTKEIMDLAGVSKRFESILEGSYLFSKLIRQYL